MSAVDLRLARQLEELPTVHLLRWIDVYVDELARFDTQRKYRRARVRAITEELRRRLDQRLAEVIDAGLG